MIRVHAPDPAEPEGRDGFVAPSALGAARHGVVAQLFLLRQFVDYRQHMGFAEQCAWAAMRLVTMSAAALWVVLPATLAAAYLCRRTCPQRRVMSGSRAQYGPPTTE